MQPSLVERIRKSLSESTFLATLDQIRADGGRRFCLGDRSLRNLQTAEIDNLQAAGCSAPDWSAILVAEDFDWRRLKGVRFLGKAILGVFRGTIRLFAGSTSRRES